MRIIGRCTGTRSISLTDTKSKEYYSFIITGGSFQYTSYFIVLHTFTIVLLLLQSKGLGVRTTHIDGRERVEGVFVNLREIKSTLFHSCSFL